MSYVYLQWEEGKQVEAGTAVSDHPLRSRLVVRLCLYGGLRSHEVVDANIEDVDPINGWIYVPHGHKNGPRYAAIDRETLRLLGVYVDARTQGPLLVRDDGRRITRWQVYYAVARAAQMVGIKKRRNPSPRMLRHTFATTWLRRKGNIRLLQKQLGHAKLESTAFYLDWMPEEIKAEYSKLFEEESHLLPVLVLPDLEGSWDGLNLGRENSQEVKQ